MHNVMHPCMGEYTSIRIRKDVAERYRMFCIRQCLASARYIEFLLEQAMVGDHPTPWGITQAAQRDWLALRALPETPSNLALATDELRAAGLDALAAERTRRRLPLQLESGVLRYRGPAPERLLLMVLNGSVVAVAQAAPKDEEPSAQPRGDITEYLT